jgi:DNA-binding CsgD family transcriptional regulator
MALARPDAAHPRGRHLIERDEPLAALGRYLGEAAKGAGRLVLIRGEAGIGKTAILSAFIEDCPANLEVLWGACDGVSTPQPFGPFEDMVDALGPELRRFLDANASPNDLGRWLLKRLATGPGHILVIEDVHWADQATLDLLAFLVRRIERLPVLVLATYRDGDSGSPSVARALGSVASLPIVRQLPLEPLSRTGVATLAGDRRVDVDELHRITAGNPFYLHEVLDAGADRIPVSVMDAVRARVARLDERGRRALQVAAVIGVRAEPWLLAAIAGEDVLGIDDSIRVGLLIKEEGIAFRHELTRMVVLQDLPVIHGIALHRRALDALERAGTADAARLAYHAEGAANREAVLRHASTAGRRSLATGALHEAIAQFRRALRFADGLEPAARAELLEPLTEALYLVNDHPAAYASATAAVALRRQATDAAATAMDLSFLALVAWANGRSDEAWQAARDAVALVEPMGDGHELGVAYATLGRMGTIEGLDNDGRAMSERALQIGRRLGDPEVTAIALASLGILELSLGDDHGWAKLRESLRIGREANLPVVVDRALNNLGWSAFDWRRFDVALDYFRQLEDHAAQSQVDRFSVSGAHAAIALAKGDWSLAEVCARTTLEAERVLAVDRGAALIILAQLAIRRGDPGSAACLEEADDIIGRLPTIGLRWPMAVVRAEQAWIAGSLEPVAAELSDVYRLACRAGNRLAIGELGLWLKRAGSLSVLDERAEAAYAIAFAGEPRTAAAEWQRLDMPYDAALSLAESSDPSDVERAYAELTRLGATAVANRVAMRLRDLGRPIPRGPRPSTRSNPRGLTEREVEIARLLALGLSNAEIADRLFLSPKTVGHHVSAVLGKLRVRRRGEVAAAINEAGAPI